MDSTTPTTAEDMLPGEYAYLAAAIQCLVATLDDDRAAVTRALDYAAMVEKAHPERIAALRERIKAANAAIWSSV